MNETTELILKQLNQKKVHAVTHELGGGDEVDVLKLKNVDSIPVSNSMLVNGAVTTEKIANQAITTEKLSPDITSSNVEVIAARASAPYATTYSTLKQRVDHTDTEIIALKAETVKKGELVVNVKDFGAKGDGVTNDTAAIQAAIDSNASFLEVFIPEGTYRLPSPIVINRQNIRIYGAGRSTTLYPDAGVTAIKMATLNGVAQAKLDNFRIYGQTNATGGISTEGFPCSYVQIKNVHIENFLATGSFGTKFSQIQECDIDNCYLYQNYNHIWIPNVVGNYCTSMHIHGISGYIGHATNLGVLIEIPVASTKISDIVIEGNQAGGIAAFGKGTQLTFESCHFEVNGGSNTVYVAGTALGKAKLTMRGNFFYGNTAPILRLDYIGDSVIENNAGLIGSGNIITDANCDIHFSFNRAEDVSQNQDAITLYESLGGNISYYETDTRGIRIQRENGVKTFHDAAAPTTLAWKRGDKCINSAPAVGSPKGWVCTVAGTPGTWVSEGNL